MKAGLQVSVLEVELCGGNNDSVPRQIIDPSDGSIHDTQKFYWCDVPTKGMKKDDLKELVDIRGNQYIMNNQGFVAVAPEQNQEQSDDATAENESKS